MEPILEGPASPAGASRHQPRPRSQQQLPRQPKLRPAGQRHSNRRSQPRPALASGRPSRPGALLALLLLALVAGHFRAAGAGQLEAKGILKRSFAGLGCLGVYDKAKFARLDRVCEECYQLYREPDIHTACRQDCFRNNVFTRCVDALLLSHDQKKFDEMVEELYGK